MAAASYPRSLVRDRTVDVDVVGTGDFCAGAIAEPCLHFRGTAFESEDEFSLLFVSRDGPRLSRTGDFDLRLSNGKRIAGNVGAIDGLVGPHGGGKWRVCFEGPAAQREFVVAVTLDEE